jgi:hypothetical protein
MENLETEKQFELELFEEQKIRSELNLEKWSFWQPSQSRGKLKARIIERDIILPNGNKTKAKVEIGFTQKGELTTFDQKVFYALIKIWEEKGKSKTYTYFSLKSIAKKLNISWGSGAIQNLTNSIDKLRITPFLWEHSYYNAQTKETITTSENTFTILDDRKLIRVDKDGYTTKQEGYFKFNDLITNNLLANYTKPVLFDTILSFKSAIAQLIYSKVDLFLTENSRYERRTKELFEDLSLEGESYKNKSKRKQMLIPALLELQGKPLSSGGYIGKAVLEPTKDGSDLKVVFEKRLRLKNTLPENHKAINTESQKKKEQLTLTDEENELLSSLLEYGVAERQATTLIKREKTAVKAQIMYYPYLTLSPAVNNPAGWILTAIRDNFSPPESYKKKAESLKAKMEAEARTKAEQKRLEKEQAIYEEKERKKELARGKYESFSEARQAEIYEKYYKKITERDYSHKPELLNLEFVQGLIRQQVLSAIYGDITKGKILE